MIKCPDCSKEFENALGLRGHAMSHTRAKSISKTEEVKPEIKEEAKEVSKPNFEKYKELPPPIVKHLELTFGNWLNHFEVGQIWREDFGGMGMYIKVPRQFSTEWKKIITPKYDNDTRKKIGEHEVEIEDIRWKPLSDISQAKTWINMVKSHVITNAYRKGIQLPNTNTGLDETKKTLEDYERALSKIS